MVPPDRLLTQVVAAAARVPGARRRCSAPQSASNRRSSPPASGVFSSQSMIDLYSAIYDSTDPSDLPESDAWQLRQAFVGKDRDARLAAIRHFLDLGKGRAREGRRARRRRPGRDPRRARRRIQDDAPDLISAMLAGGLRPRRRALGRCVVGDMDDEAADRCWAMLALAAPDARRRRAQQRAGSTPSSAATRAPASSAARLLVAGLAGLGRISTRTRPMRSTAAMASALAATTSWTRMIDAAAARRQPALCCCWPATGLQATRPAEFSPAHLYHAIAASSATGQDYTARMIAAEALSRT